MPTRKRYRSLCSTFMLETSTTHIPDGISESDGVVGISGVSFEESAGELAGVAADEVGPFATVFPTRQIHLIWMCKGRF